MKNEEPISIIRFSDVENTCLACYKNKYVIYVNEKPILKTRDFFKAKKYIAKNLVRKKK